MGVGRDVSLWGGVARRAKKVRLGAKGGGAPMESAPRPIPLSVARLAGPPASSGLWWWCGGVRSARQDVGRKVGESDWH